MWQLEHTLRFAPWQGVCRILFLYTYSSIASVFFFRHARSASSDVLPVVHQHACGMFEFVYFLVKLVDSIALRRVVCWLLIKVPLRNGWWWTMCVVVVVRVNFFIVLALWHYPLFLKSHLIIYILYMCNVVLSLMCTFAKWQYTCIDICCNRTESI